MTGAISLRPSLPDQLSSSGFPAVNDSAIFATSQASQLRMTQLRM